MIESDRAAPKDPGARRLLPLCLLLLLAAQAQAQDILVSKGIKGTNLAPQPTVRPDTGDVLVVWSNLSEDGKTSQIWAGYLKRKSNGTFGRAKKARLVSAKDGFHSNPRGAWIPAAKRYLVVWDTGQNPASPSKILGRVINKRGKPKGPVKTIADDSRSNFVAHPVPTANGASVIYSATDSTAGRASTTGGIVRVDMGKDFDVDSAVVVDAYDATALVQVPERVRHLFDCQVVVIQEGYGTEQAAIHVLLLRDGALRDRIKLPGNHYGTTRMAEIGGQVAIFHLMAWQSEDLDADGGAPSGWLQFDITNSCTTLSRDEWVIDPRRMGAFSVDLVSRGIPPRNRDSLPTTDVIFVEGDEVKTRGISAEGEAGEAQSSRMRQLATMIAPNSDSLWGDQELEVIAIR